MKAAAPLLALFALAACDPSYALRGDPPPVGKCRAGPGASAFVAESFYRRALVERRVREGFEGFVAPGFVEHKPDVASADREGTIAFLEGLMTQLPDARWEVVRVVADADMAVIHARMTPAPGAPLYAIADFFRIADCRIVEHWDVVAGPPQGARNPLPRF